ncbi:MAG TPA: AEC family transporter [Candidatus Omnitrophota bacterium]|nr:AEC family transporter [Candidatus Omnitrophota bacterium]
MFIEAFKTTYGAILELVVLGAVGFFIVKKNYVNDEGARVLSGLVIGLFLPCLMFSEIVRRFDFKAYPEWWMLPIYSLLLTFAWYACGSLVMACDKSLKKNPGEFLSICSFQNSGYLPLPLAASLLPQGRAEDMYILIFLFLLGFNMTIFSVGIVMLTRSKEQHFDYKHMFNAPVISTLLALALVFFNLNKSIPEHVMKPIDILGRCAVPLSILVVGGNLASIKLTQGLELRPLSWGLLIKLVILPLIFIGFVLVSGVNKMLGLLLILQSAMPPAALLSVISKSHNQGARLINQAIFYGHILCIITIPIFLAIFWSVSGKSF